MAWCINFNIMYYRGGGDYKICLQLNPRGRCMGLAAAVVAVAAVRGP